MMDEISDRNGGGSVADPGPKNDEAVDDEAGSELALRAFVSSMASMTSAVVAMTVELSERRRRRRRMRKSTAPIRSRKAPRPAATASAIRATGLRSPVDAASADVAVGIALEGCEPVSDQ